MSSKEIQPQLVERDGSVTPPEERLQTSSSLENQIIEKQESSTNEFPDGGLRAWSVAIGSSLVMFCTMGMINSFGVFQAYYQTHQLKDLSPSTISWIGSLQVFFMFSSGLVGGPLFDRYGTKFLLAHGVLNGWSNGMTLAPAMAATPQYFNKKRGAAMGLMIAGSSLGGLVMPIVLAKMLYSSIGFGWTMRIVGFIFLVLLLVAGVAIRPRFPPRQTDFLLPSAFKNKVYTMTIVACWFAVIGVFVPIFYLPSYAELHGMSAELAAYLITILNAASVFGRVIPGILSDKLGRLNVLIAATLSTGILIFCWPETKSNAGVIVYAAVFGFCSGGVVSGMSVGLAACAPSPKDFGTLLGMGMAIISIAVLISPPINGALVNHYHAFNQAAYFSGTITVFGGLLALSIKFIAPGGFTVRS